MVGNINAEQVILNGALASRVEDQDPIDLAVLSGLKDQKRNDYYERINTV